MGRDWGRSFATRRGIEPDRCAFRRRDGARRGRIFAWTQRRLDRRRKLDRNHPTRHTRQASSAVPAARRLPLSVLCRCWRSDVIWAEPARRLSPLGLLCRPHPQGREAGRSSGAGADQVRAGDQPQDRKVARPRSTADAARARRRGDRVMRRRDFIILLGGAAAAWPLVARAQQERMRRIGVLNTLAADDALAQARQGAFLQGLQQSGWTIGRNVQVEARWAAGDPDRLRKYAVELVALAPDVILASGNAAAAPVLQATRTVPIVFVIVPDPVGAGFVDSLPQPGGNATGFLAFEYGLSGKWLELLKDIAPGVTRVAVLRDPA